MKVLIADKFEKAGVAALREAGCDVTLSPDLTGDELMRAIGDTACTVLVVRSTKVTADMLRVAPKLRMVIRAGSGYDTIDVSAATAQGIRVCNCPGMNAVAVAELTLGLMIALDRRIVDETDDLRHGVWNKKKYSQSRGLMGRTLGIVGLGRIGYEVAVRAAAFGMNLIYRDPVAKPAWESSLGLRRVEFDDLLRESDFVTLHVPGGDQTCHLIGASELKKMKSTAFLLNCSRGGIVDEQALAIALSAGVIAGAALDVYEVEPAASDRVFSDPIQAAPHLYGTHHVGASTEQAQNAVADEVVRIVRTYRDDGTFLHCVNPPATAVDASN